MKEIPIAGGSVAFVDDKYFKHLSQFKWHLSSTGYATRTVWFGRQYQPTHREIAMHRDICPTTLERPMVDHRNGNKLDNQSTNLRACNKSENGTNRGKTKFNTTGYKGVVKHPGKYCKGWIAQLRFQNKNRYLGYFPTPRAAAEAYNKAAKETFGEFANLNQL